jgi:hypothetical protein
MQCCSCNVKRTCAAWGISGDVCYIYILCSYAGMLTTIAQDCLARTGHEDECELPLTMRTLPICGKKFSSGEDG